MAYDFITVREDDDQGNPVARIYIVCSDCRMPVGRDPMTREWAAFDAPAALVDTGNRDDNGDPVYATVQRWKVALCAPCYVKAFNVRYPGAEPPKLYDGRVKDAKPVRKSAQ